MVNRAAVRQHVEPDTPASRPDDKVVRLHEAGRATLSSLEEQVVSLALRDRLGSLEEPNWLERTVARLFGLAPRGRALADPRLEALRRAVVVTRHRHHLPDTQAAELREAGFAAAQIRIVEQRALTL